MLFHQLDDCAMAVFLGKAARRTAVMRPGSGIGVVPKQKLDNRFVSVLSRPVQSCKALGTHNADVGSSFHQLLRKFQVADCGSPEKRAVFAKKPVVVFHNIASHLSVYSNPEEVGKHNHRNCVHDPANSARLPADDLDNRVGEETESQSISDGECQWNADRDHERRD